MPTEIFGTWRCSQQFDQSETARSTPTWKAGKRAHALVQYFALPSMDVEGRVNQDKRKQSRQVMCRLASDQRVIFMESYC